MIKNTLQKTKLATYSVLVPSRVPEYQEFPTPSGTGFFISESGYFITARHVIQKNPTSPSSELFEISKLKLSRPDPIPSIIDGLSIVNDFPEYDLVILKADFEKNKHKTEFKNRKGFNSITVDFDIKEEGEAVYAYGYPLAEHEVIINPNVMFGTHTFYPRATSLIISSHHDKIGPVISGKFPMFYVIDKALNYGNSGGPIIVPESGKVISVCIRFQPVTVQQYPGSITIPSLYGVTVSLKNIEKEISDFLS